MAAKLIVTPTKGGSRITLVGTSGTELLSSKVFTEPRGKGATLRSLKGLLGDDIVIEDHTAATASRAVASTKSAPSPVKTARIAAAKTARIAAAKPARIAAAKPASRPKPASRRKAAVSK